MYELSDFAHPYVQVKTVQITHKLGNNLTVYVSKFIPEEGDKLQYKWENASGVHVMDMPPYSLTNLEQIQINMRQYLRQTRDVFLHLLKRTNDFTWHFISKAIDYVNTREVSLFSIPGNAIQGGSSP